MFCIYFKSRCIKHTQTKSSLKHPGCARAYAKGSLWVVGGRTKRNCTLRLKSDSQMHWLSKNFFPTSAKLTFPDASLGPCEFSLRRHRRCFYPFLQTLLGSCQNGHEALQGRDEVLLDGLRLRSGRVPPAVVHLPQRWDEDFRQQLLHTF